MVTVKVVVTATAHPTQNAVIGPLKANTQSVSGT
jgi:hypothetical protein